LKDRILSGKDGRGGPHCSLRKLRIRSEVLRFKLRAQEEV
jgi:hypothetical protein